MVSIKDECTLAWLVDLEKAYDSIWREGLMVKLYNMGIKGKIWRWINNFVFLSKYAYFTLFHIDIYSPLSGPFHYCFYVLCSLLPDTV
jgi:hypothetical protein